MARSLTVARAMVAPGQRTRYLELLAARAEAARRRGARFWAFESRMEPGSFMEFTETADGSAGARTEGEIAVERELRGIATYGPRANELWEELALHDGA